ncbi:MAG TPA: AraC family transcriptional regulator [Alcanivorax sp.]|jgi:AraC-like DNA-binding protein|nr:MAG: AraC family transcriptional regulator [Alcanivorax sp. Nap_24]HIK75802.1 AraC family transcriptional regulator [Alcanivorax sp.]|tara:strand:+ start:1921 stop:2943 length:1023 start_codon:yes stop_codon:yes gene_type:complete
MTVQITNRLRPAIHPTYPRLLCAYLHERGFDNAVIFQDTRLQWEQLLGDHRYLSLEQMSRLIRRAIDLTGQPWIGLETAGVTSVSAHGPLGYAVVSAPDLREVLRVVSRYVGVRFQLVGVRFEEFDDHAVLTLDEQVDLAEIREFVTGSILATYFQLVDTVTSRRLRDVAVTLPLDEPVWASVYEEYLGCPVTFGTGQLTITLPAALLDTPCLTADPTTHRAALRDCEHQLRQIQSGGPLSQRIGVMLLDRDGDYPTLDDTAEEFAMSRRTLIRKLKAEGTSFQELLDDVRRELAAWYLLETSLPVERIAEKLGYQDPSNFSRTFQRWFGTTPLRMRRAP